MYTHFLICQHAKTRVFFFQITGYPTIKLYGNGNLLEEYNGPSTTEGLLNFVNSWKNKIILKK
jgi:hypothetical protein